MRSGKKALLMMTGSLCAATMMALWPVEPILEVEAAVVEQGALVQSVVLRGTVCHAHQTPYVSLKDGIVRQVYVQAGDEIQKGQLLFKLDTAAEEKALMELYKIQAAVTRLENVTAMVSPQSMLEWQQKEAQLLASIESSCIRALTDGVMEAVYVEENSVVSAAAQLGMSHGVGIQIAAAMPMGMEMKAPGAAVVAHRNDAQIPLTLKTVSMRDTGIALFEPVHTADSDAFRIGENVTIELVEDVQSISALIPLCAITADDTVWVVQAGKAYEKHFEMDECNRAYAGANMEWAGQTVIRSPERYHLKDGMPVQVKNEAL